LMYQQNLNGPQAFLFPEIFSFSSFYHCGLNSSNHLPSENRDECYLDHINFTTILQPVSRRS
jgi:hypothetical protein